MWCRRIEAVNATVLLRDTLETNIFWLSEENDKLESD